MGIKQDANRIQQLKKSGLSEMEAMDKVLAEYREDG